MSKLRDHYLFHAGISCFFYLGYGAFTVVLSMYCQDIGMSASQIAYIVSFAPLLSIATQPFFGYLADKWQSPRKVSILLSFANILCMFIFATVFPLNCYYFPIYILGTRLDIWQRNS